MYGKTKREISATSPELAFMTAVCSGLVDDAMSFFHERKLFGGAKPVVDTPYKRFEGLEEIRNFVVGFPSIFNATGASVVPVIQTQSNGRSVTEAVLNFIVDGAIDQVPMFIVGDLRTKGSLDELRIYCHFSYVPGLTAYRKPMFQPAHLEMGDPGLLTGAVREYYEALHHVPAADVDRIMSAIGEGCKFGGYEPEKEKSHEVMEREYIRGKFEMMSRYIPRCIGMRYETIIDDNRTCIIEWVHVVTEAGQKELSRVALSGIAAYERGEDGLLSAIRISDYAGYERTIDWTETPVSKEEAFQTNLVSRFPAGVGLKEQSS